MRSVTRRSRSEKNTGARTTEMSHRRRNAPRFLLTRAGSKGGASTAGFAYTYHWAEREARRLAEHIGYVITVIDCAKGRRVYTAQPSPAAIARRKAAPKPEQTSGGQNASSFNGFFTESRTREPEYLRERPELPEVLPLVPARPTDFGFDSTF